MNAQYQSTRRSTRAAAAIAAAVTVVMLFDFVAGLGDSNMSQVGVAGASHAVIAQAAVNSRATPSVQ
jgi:hypothetical protein